VTNPAIGRRFARVVTNTVLRYPRLWRLLRGGMRRQFDALAPRWDALRDPDHLAPYELALESVDPPRRALDVGTGTGAGAFSIARRFTDAEVVGVDLSERMLDEARRKTPTNLSDRVRFDAADASKLPFEDGSFDLVALANMIPFVDELERVLAPGGQVLFAFSVGAATPIYVAPDRLRSELEPRGFTDFAEFAAGKGTALLARKSDPS
jgi:SAM-dependent methyltransferase